MNHKLRVLVRVDVDPAQVTLEITGCVTQSDFSSPPAHRAPRLPPRSRAPPWSSTSTAPPTWTLKCCWTSGVSLMPDTCPLPMPGTPQRPDRSASPSTSRRCCQSASLHVGADGEVLAGLDTDDCPAPVAVAGNGTAKLPDCSTSDPAPDPTPGWGGQQPAGRGNRRRQDLGTIDGLALSEYFEGTLDPVATVRALSDTALCQLADALYRHLDTSSPSFGAHTWYELAAEELQNRHLRETVTARQEDELAPDTALA